MIRSTIGSLLNNAFVRPLLVLLRLDYTASRFRNNWAGKRLDTGKSLQQNMGFSEQPEIQQALARVHGKIQAVYAQHGGGGSVLDVGCGVGLYLRDFPAEAECHGIDVSVNFIEPARKMLPKAIFHHGDYLSYDFTQCFSMIYSVEVLQYIPPSKIPELVTKLSHDLVPGGVVLIHYQHAISKADCLYPDLTYVQYSPSFLEGQFEGSFEIVSHTHAFDMRPLDFKYDPVRYDEKMGRSLRNCGVLVGRKKRLNRGAER